jgi:SAM-dependent methyltransferase
VGYVYLLEEGGEMPISESQDAFGRALLSYFEREPAHSVVERDDGYFDAENIGTYFADFRKWALQQRRAMRYVRGRVLDIGCGAGRHALYLQRQRLQVVGIDESPLAIRVSRARGVKTARIASVTRIPGDLGVFDTILMMGNNLGLLGNLKRARWLLKRFSGITSDDGRIIAETLNPYKTRNPFHKRYQKANRQRGRMSGQVRLRLHYQTYTTRWFDYLFVSPAELRGIVSGTGWCVSKIIGSSGPQYIAVLSKPD